MQQLPDVFSTPAAVSLMATIESKSKEMKNHRVFNLIHGIDDLRTFMTWHVFAVWDFMSLVKRLQIEYTCVSVPWVPPRNPQTARLINEIVLGEESDESPSGGHKSHYDLYVDAMQEIGADTLQIKTFIKLIMANKSVPDALATINAPPAIKQFVSSTILQVSQGSIEQVLGSFVFGREDAIPEMFQSLLDTWHLDEKTAPIFVYYLQRHIQLDGEEHGPAAMRMLADQVKNDTAKLVVLLDAAIDAIDNRIKLWDALAVELEQQQATRSAKSALSVQDLLTISGDLNRLESLLKSWVAEKNAQGEILNDANEFSKNIRYTKHNIQLMIEKVLN